MKSAPAGSSIRQHMKFGNTVYPAICQVVQLPLCHICRCTSCAAHLMARQTKLPTTPPCRRCTARWLSKSTAPNASSCWHANWTSRHSCRRKLRRMSQRQPHRRSQPTLRTPHMMCSTHTPRTSQQQTQARVPFIQEHALACRILGRRGQSRHRRRHSRVQHTLQGRKRDSTHMVGACRPQSVICMQTLRRYSPPSVIKLSCSTAAFCTSYLTLAQIEIVHHGVVSQLTGAMSLICSLI